MISIGRSLKLLWTNGKNGVSNRDDNVDTTQGRLRLLLHALPTEIVGQIENQSDERQQAARYFLDGRGLGSGCRVAC